jgi:hypothetical protein
MRTHVVLWLGLSAAACAAEQEAVVVSGVHAELRELSKEEALADFDTLVESFRANYAPLERKEERYGFTFGEHVQESRLALRHADSGAERERVFASFTARFNDMHVQLGAALPTEQAPDFAVPVRIAPIEDKFVVYAVDDEQVPLKRGDELIAVDGVPPEEVIARFESLIGAPNPLTKRHALAARLTQRRAIFADGIAEGDPIVLRVRDAKGGERDLELRWQKLPNALTARPAVPAAGSGMEPLGYSSEAADTIAAEAGAMGSIVPYFLTAEVRRQFEISARILPSQRALAEFGVPEQALLEFEYFATKYVYEGKRILLLRMPDYDVRDELDMLRRLNFLRALLSEQQETSDALVLDDTHNPGGSMYLAQALATIFASEPLNGVVERMHADRLQIASYLQRANALRQIRDVSDADLSLALELEQHARTLDALFSAGEALSEPIPLFAIPSNPDADRVRWTKPALVLVDELSASSGDLFPLLIQANHLAPLFGQRTAGAGGNVESVALLPHSARELRLTRGSFTALDPSGAYPDERFVEDNGVTPDIEYSHTLDDFRAGYVGYFKAFNDALLEQGSK